MTTRPIGSAEEERGLRALELLHRLNTQPDAQAASELGDWMNQSPENRREFLETSTLFHAVSRCPPLSLTLEELVNEASKHFAAAAAETDEATAGEEAAPIAKPNRPWLRFGIPVSAIAAGVMAVATGIALFPSTERYSAATAPEPFTLEDKSSGQVYEQSHIEVSMTRNLRLVKLSGGASFKVAHDPRPFQVDTAGLSITARGTEFNVIRREEERRTDIYLAEGRLEVQGPKAGSFKMIPDEIVRVSDDGTLEKSRARAARRHDMRVDGMTYAQVADAINRQNVTYQIEIRGAARSLQAWGVVNIADPDAWLLVLEHEGLHVATHTGLKIVEAAQN
jgi:ferric-dicitrate binding protein FerR (iron transport regulator)